MLKKFRKASLSLPDLFAFALILAIFVGFTVVAKTWSGPLQVSEPVTLSFRSLPLAAMLSLSRVFFAFIVCFFSSLVLGYWAAHSKAAEQLILPLVDIGQSIPVLGFLPGLVITFVAVFPSSRVGLELAAVLTLFTGMGWNIMLSFYGSIKTIPREYGEIIKAYGYNPLGTMLRLEIPYATNGLVWNSMLSVAGGWFFLTVCESYTLGDTSYHLAGLGSYMVLAAEQDNVLAMIAGVVTMLLLLVATDFFVWRPLLRWSARFQRQVSNEDDEEDKVILFFAKSKQITNFVRKIRRRYAAKLFTARRKKKRVRSFDSSKLLAYAPQAFFVLLVVLCVWGLVEGVRFALEIPRSEWFVLAKDTTYTLLRVIVVLILSTITMLPLGLWLGMRPSLVRKLQPVLQVAAAFPMPMIFPVLTSLFLFFSVPISIGSILLMMTGATWFLLFNVISGVASTPPELLEFAKVSGMSSVEIMRRVYLPVAFPQIVTGLISAVGGAWNTSIVAELVNFRGKEYIAPGLGAYIAKCASKAEYPELVAGVLMMVLVIVLINRFFWARLYNLAESRYRLDS